MQENDIMQRQHLSSCYMMPVEVIYIAIIYLKKIGYKLANEIGIEIRIAHYPPYCSKWNPIEHRLFCHITRSLQGMILKNIDLTKELIEKTTTTTGLKVTANIIKKAYETGRKVDKDFKKNMQIIFDEKLGHLNYRAVPLS